MKIHYNSSVEFSCSVVSNSFWPHGLQHSRLCYPSPTPGVYLNSWPLNWLCPPTITSSVLPFSFSLQSFSALGSFQMNKFFASGGQSTGILASASVPPMNIQNQGWFCRIGWLDLLAVQGTLKSLLQHHSSKASILQYSAFFMVQLSHPHTTIGKTIALTLQTFVSKVTSLLFNTPSRFNVLSGHSFSSKDRAS